MTISVWCGGKWHAVDGKLCKRTAKSGHRYGHYKNNVMYWVERLMLAGVCLTLMAGCSLTYKGPAYDLSTLADLRPEPVQNRETPRMLSQRGDRQRTVLP